MNKRRLNPSRVIYSTMQWSKAFVPIVALLAALASSVRTIQTVAEIYAASGSAPIVVVAVSGALAFAVEGAIFILSLTYENQQAKWRLARKRRHVTTLATIARSIAVKLGIKPPLSYDQLPESDGGVGILLTIAFIVAIVTNLYMGIKPLINEMSSNSIQTFLKDLLNARADIQIRFIVDLVIALFPPFFERTAGHLTARFASEVAGSMNRQEVKMEQVKVSAASRTTEKAIELPVERSMNASERVVEYLTEHPEAFKSISQNKLAKQLGVSVGTVNAVFKSMKAADATEHDSNG